MRGTLNTLLVLSLACAPAAPLAARGSGAAVTELSQDQKKLLRETCFEIVVPRPQRDNLKYEKELPWELLPFKLRKDPYISIGTAFAVSRTELVTAFHVLSLADESLTWRTFLIRDQQGKVYELDRILACHEAKDVVRFTVKDRTFDRWLQLNPEVELNSTVFTSGNAYGEGVVVRRGELLGSVPEDENGEWNLLKSSADVNAGNSGGPLLDTEGKVLGIVLRKKDNLCYALPVSELQNLPAGKAFFHNKIIYGFTLLPDKSKPRPSDFQFDLPMPYAQLRARAAEARRQEYRKEMDAFLESQKPELFPAGDASLEALYAIPTSTTPQTLFRSDDTRLWGLSGLEYKTTELPRNGSCRVATTAGLVFVDLRRPDDVALSALHASPRLAVELLLKGINVPRELAGQKIRIISLGDPMRSTTFRDRLGRPWQRTLWHMDHSDEVFFLYSTPTPRGLTALVKVCNTDLLDQWTYDMDRIVDFLYVPYLGRLKDWSAFMQDREKLPSPFQDMRVDFEAEKQLRFSGFQMTMDLRQDQMQLTPNATLGLYMGFSFRNGAPAWDLRRLVVGEDESDSYFVFLRNPRPVEQLPEGEHKFWKELVRQQHPYTRTAFSEDGHTNIAMVHPAFQAPGDPGKSPHLSTLYLSRQGSVPGEKMKEQLESLAASLRPAPQAGAGSAARAVR